MPNRKKRDIIARRKVSEQGKSHAAADIYINGMDYGISLENVESIEEEMNVVVVPTSPANIRGIIRLHGEILPVFSLASRFGLGNIAVDNLVVVNVGGMKLALEVEKGKRKLWTWKIPECFRCRH